MPLRNICIRTIGKLFLILMFIAMLGACSESSSPPSKQEAASPAEKHLAQLQKEADSGNAEAQYKLGVMYEKGEGVPKDDAKAVEWYQKAAAQGNADAQFNLGWMYADGKGVLKNVNKVNELWQKAAKAVELWQKAAAQGNADAQFKLGWMYLSGKGVPYDDAKAEELFQKAAAQGNAGAQFMLGEMYKATDEVKAVEWYQKAAAQGDVHAQYGLGWIYDGSIHEIYEGKYAPKGAKAVPKDYAKAIEWYQKAASLGNADAQTSLGRMYKEGKGVPKDAAKAVEWWQKAAVQGDTYAQFLLGGMYRDGEGVPRDLVLAYAWCNLAAAQGDKAAKILRDIIKLNSAQRAEAERLSSNWKVGQVLRREGESGSGIGSAAKVTGTAFVISTEGHAITNYHVVAGCKELRVQGRTELIQLITRDEVSDLALLKIPGESRAAAAMTPYPAGLRQGQDIVVFGFPLDSVLSSGGNLTPGVVSAITGLGNNSNQIQITAPIQPGSSGSPVMDKKGHIVGVVSMKLSDIAMAKYTGNLPQNVNFAINGQTLKTFLDANRVSYKTGWSFFSREKSLADLGDEARKWTTIVECWK
ncbi:MAG: tetratricopeptide repeat-containing serine protease family protein [Nitrospirota bacterium]